MGFAPSRNHWHLGLVWLELLPLVVQPWIKKKERVRQLAHTAINSPLCITSPPSPLARLVAHTWLEVIVHHHHNRRYNSHHYSNHRYTFRRCKSLRHCRILCFFWVRCRHFCCRHHCIFRSSRLSTRRIRRHLCVL